MRMSVYHQCILFLLWRDQFIVHVTGAGLWQATIATVPADIDVPSEEELATQTLDWAHQIQAATSERNTADSAEKTAESHEGAMEAGSQAAHAHLRASKYRKRVQDAAQNAQDDQRKANKAAQATRALVEKFEIIARASAEQAVAEVVKDAIKGLNEEVRKTVEAYRAEKEDDYKLAKAAAVSSALPFDQAKEQAEKNVNDYLVHGREAATAAAALKWDAYRLAAAANGFQYKGHVITAQEEMVKAHDLMDTALRYQAQAEAMQKEAEKLHGNLNTRNYDSAAARAAAYGAYAANPSGDAMAIPPPPMPLREWKER